MIWWADGAQYVTIELFGFYVFAAIAVVSSLLVVGQPKPMHSVMLLIVSFGALSGLYVLLDAPFTAVTQIIIYAGAIMVLFLFVVMLLNAPTGDRGCGPRCCPVEAWRRRRAVGGAGRRGGLGVVPSRRERLRRGAGGRRLGQLGRANRPCVVHRTRSPSK